MRIAKLLLPLVLAGLLTGCCCDICCSTRVPPDPCAPCGPAATDPGVCGPHSSCGGNAKSPK